MLIVELRTRGEVGGNIEEDIHEKEWIHFRKISLINWNNFEYE